MMILIASMAQIAALMAAPVAVAEPVLSADAPRCALHHLSIPAGKGPVSTIMRCSDRSTEAKLSMRDERSVKTPDSPLPPPKS